MCNNPNCQNTTIELKTIENCILNIIENHFNYTTSPNVFEKEDNTNELFYINKEIKKLKLQFSNIFDLLEQKIYSKETFFRAKTNVGKKYRDINITKRKI